MLVQMIPISVYARNSLDETTQQLEEQKTRINNLKEEVSFAASEQVSLSAASDTVDIEYRLEDDTL